LELTSRRRRRRYTGLAQSAGSCGAAAALGHLLAATFEAADRARSAALASGGILAMLANSLIPFAHERSESAGIWTAIGFCSALAMGA
jgi:hypothetical protein